jgi:N-acetyl sugar amidotransferase
MKYCNRCLYPANHPLNITFDKEGVCSGCRIHEEKDTLDWTKRFEKLKKIVEPYKKSNRSINNCIVPVSGARDSYFIVHIVKNILGMNPLLVTYNKNYNTLIGIRNLSYLKTQFGCPLFTMTVSPDRIKKITHHTIKKMGSIYWHCIAGQTVFPVQIAYKFKIPLIIWGAHQGLDQVGMFSHEDEVEMTRKYRKEHDLMGFEAEDLIDDGPLTHQDLQNFLYPHDKEIAAVGIRGIYLNNYIRWDTKAQHEKMIELYDYESDTQQRTFDTYNDLDCYHYSGLHDKIKYMKWGYGKVTDHASREIRLKRMTRSEGIELLKKYQTIEPEDLGTFCDWIGMSNDNLMNEIDEFRDKSIWKKEKKIWFLKDSIFDHFNGQESNNVALEKIEDCFFNANSKRTDQKEISKYTILGRGWVDN